MNLFLVGAHVRVVDGPQAGHTGFVTAPPHPKLTGYRTVELEGAGTLHRIPTDCLIPAEENPMENVQTTEVQRLAAEPETVAQPEVTAVVSQEPFTIDGDEPADLAWKIESITDADWALSRLKDIDQEIADAKAMEEAAITRIKLRTEKLTAAAKRGKEFFESKLREFAETHRAELIKGKSKSRKLVHGTIGWKKAGGAPVKKDEAALLDWARQQPPESEFLKIEESPNWALIKAHVKKTGELVPGTDLEPEREDFYVETIE